MAQLVFSTSARPQWDQFRKEMNEALAGVAKKYGVQIDAGKITIGDGYCDVKVSVKQIAANGAVMDKDAEYFKQLGSIFGLKPEHLFTNITYGGKVYQIVGMASSRKGANIIIKKDDKRYKLHVSEVLKCLNLPASDAANF